MISVIQIKIYSIDVFEEIVYLNCIFNSNIIIEINIYLTASCPLMFGRWRVSRVELKIWWKADEITASIAEFIYNVLF